MRLLFIFIFLIIGIFPSFSQGQGYVFMDLGNGLLLRPNIGASTRKGNKEFSAMLLWKTNQGFLKE